MKLRVLALCVVGLAAATVPAVMKADTPGRHPAYRRARADLRAVQFLMRTPEEPNVRRWLEKVNVAAEAAVHEIDRADVIDQKGENPPVDAIADRRGRLAKMVELLRSARRDLASEEDNGRANGWRDAAYRHIDEALDFMHKAATEAHLDHELGF